MQRCLPSDSWGGKATAFRMLNIYGCHFNQNTNLHKKVHDTDHIESVCLAYSVMEKLQKTRTGTDVHLGYEPVEVPGREVQDRAANDWKELPASQRSVSLVSQLRNEWLL